MAQNAGPGTRMPPALQAAIISGNGAAVAQAITTLSAGDTARTAELVRAALAAAEQLVESNPQAAIAVATSAMNVINNPVFITAAANDSAIAGSLLSSSVSAARIASNPAILSINPTLALQVASSASTVASIPAVANTNPQQAVTVVATARAVATSDAVIENVPASAQAAAVSTVNQAGSDLADNDTVTQAVPEASNPPVITPSTPPAPPPPPPPPAATPTPAPSATPTPTPTPYQA